MLISVMTPKGRETDLNFDKKINYATATDFKRFRKTVNGDLSAPIKAAYNQPTINHFDSISIQETAGIKK
jgi:hypothetical protein